MSCRADCGVNSGDRRGVGSGTAYGAGRGVLSGGRLYCGVVVPLTMWVVKVGGHVQRSGGTPFW